MAGIYALYSTRDGRVRYAANPEASARIRPTSGPSFFAIQKAATIRICSVFIRGIPVQGRQLWLLRSRI